MSDAATAPKVVHGAFAPIFDLFQRLSDSVDSAARRLEQPVFDAILAALQPINTWLNNLPPYAWHLAAVGLFVVSALAVLFVPRTFIFAGAPDKAVWRDLRLWTVLSLLPYIAAYYFLP